MIKNLPKIYKWFKLVERKESALMIDYLIRGITTANTKKVLSLDRGFERYLYLDKPIYWDHEEAQKVTDYLKIVINKRGYKYLLQLIKKWLKIGKELLQMAQKLSKDNNSKKTDRRLLADFIKFSNQNWKLSTALLLPLAIEGQLANKIGLLLAKENLQENKKKSYFTTLIFPERESSSAQELIAFYRLSSSIHNFLKDKKPTRENIIKVVSDKKIKQKIKTYLNNFAWVGARWYIGNGWNEKDVIERLVRQPSGNYNKKAKDLEKLVHNNKKETADIVKKFGWAKKETELIKTTKEYVFIRTHRTDVFNRAGFAARPFLSEIAKRLGISYPQLIFLSAEETRAALERKKLGNLLSKIKERQKAFGALLYNREVIIFEGEDIDIFRKQQRIYEAAESLPKEGLKGMVACVGKVTGVVKIVLNENELNKVRQGDILVTSMTTPDFVPAMERAAAFVTNEGGITCHAAIVSREMNKPCIIGTKIATKVLKDGDLVEVDADKGTVRMINRK